MQPHLKQDALPEHFTAILTGIENVAQSYLQAGRIENALQISNIGKSLIDMPEVTQQDRALFLLLHGKILVKTIQYQNGPTEEALLILEQARDLAQSIQNEQIAADTLNEIGYAHYITASHRHEGDPHLFLSYFQQALEKYQALSDESGSCRALFHLGLTFDVLSQLDQAENIYRQALQIAERNGYLHEEAEVYRHLGFHAQHAGHLQQAQQYFEQALNLTDTEDNLIYKPFAYIALAEANLALGDVKAATTQSQRALELVRQTSNKKALIFALYCNGKVSQAKQEDQQARTYYEEAYAVAQAITLKPWMEQAATALRETRSNS